MRAELVARLSEEKEHTDRKSVRMATEGEEAASAVKSQAESSTATEDIEPRSSGPVVQENGSADSHDELFQMVTQLRLENEFLKSQFEGLKNLQQKDAGCSQQTEIDRQDGEDVKQLLERLDSLNKELLEEKQTRAAAEEALKHLRTVYSEADARSQELSTKLAEAQQKMDREIKERDEKYSELDSKFSRLHKRAKQRIQEVQK
ncbi:hypothetical protein CRG98_016097, partial [Punica granatum]